MNTTQEKPNGAVDGKFFCTSCSITRSIEGARLVPTGNGRRRWACAYCVARKSQSGARTTR
jgi:hypothetical protein